MLLHRYSDINFILHLDLKTALALFAKAEEKERDERLRRQWEVQLPAMAITGKAISFEEYKSRVTGADIDMRPVDVIMAEIDSIERELEEAKNGII